MIDYTLAKELKDAGFMQSGERCIHIPFMRGEYCDLSEEDHNKHCKDYDCKKVVDADLYVPTLSELIEACGTRFHTLGMDDETHWVANYRVYGESKGATPEEGVAKLWLALNKPVDKS